MQIDARGMLAGLEEAARRPVGEPAGVDAVQLARDVLLSEQEFRKAERYLSGTAAAEEGRERGLSDWLKGTGWGSLAIVGVTPFGTLGKAGKALSAVSRLEDVVDAGLTAQRLGFDALGVERAVDAGRVTGIGSPRVAEAVSDLRGVQWGIPEDLDPLTKSVLQFQRSAGMSADEAFASVNRTRASQGLPPIEQRPTGFRDEIFSEQGTSRVYNYFPDERPDAPLRLEGFSEVPLRDAGPVLDSDISAGRRRFFHGTPISNLDSIIENGLKVSETGGLGPGVYGTNRFTLARTFGSFEDAGGIPEGFVYPSLVVEFVAKPSKIAREFNNGAEVAISSAVPSSDIAAIHTVAWSQNAREWRVVQTIRANPDLGSVFDDYKIRSLRTVEGDISPIGIFNAQYPENIGRALRAPEYFEGRPPAGVAQAEVNERIIEGSLALQADPLVANRLFGAELGRQLDEILPVEDLIDDYATFSAPSYGPLRLRSTRVVDKDRGILDVDPLDTPLRRLGLEINEDFLSSERALAFYAQQYKNATRKRERLAARTRFVDEIARTLSNQGRFMTRNSRGKPVFYVERQAAVDNIAARTGINRNVIAGASASASQQAPPMEEAFRLFMAAPFIKIENGKAVFDTAGFREMFRWGDVKKVRAAREGVGDFPRNKQGEYKIQEFIESAGESLADLINNPDFLNRRVRGIAHKTSPYAVLALDGLNPYAVVADTNYWYVIAGNKALGKKVLTREGLKDWAAGRSVGAGGKQNIPGPMSAGLPGSVMPAAQTRALAAAAGPMATPSSVQADIWFPLRNILNGAQDDAFFIPGEGANAVRTGLMNVLDARLVGNNAAAKRYEKALRELLESGGTTWEDMMVAALNNLGAAAGPRTTERLRDMAAASYAKFGNEVGAGTDMWTRVVRNGEDVLIANPTNWRATLAYGDRFTDKDNIVEGVEAAQRITERIQEALVPFLRGASAPAVLALAYGMARSYGLDEGRATEVAEEIAGDYDA